MADKPCRCGHPAKAHVYPSAGSAMYGDCHECRCELYNPVGGLKGVPIHPLFAFTEDQFRFVSCVNCGRFRVLPDGTCDACGWDNDNGGISEKARLDYRLGSSTGEIRKSLSFTTIREVKSVLEEYCAVVLASDLSPASQGIYINHASFFVRWLAGEFDPGARKNPYPLRRKANIVA